MQALFVPTKYLYLKNCKFENLTVLTQSLTGLNITTLNELCFDLPSTNIKVILPHGFHCGHFHQSQEIKFGFCQNFWFVFIYKCYRRADGCCNSRGSRGYGEMEPDY